MRVSAVSNPWLRPAPDAPPDRQLLFGDPFEVAHEKDGWVWGTSLKDGYQGCVVADTLGPETDPTHWVATRSTWGFASPDIKSAPLIEFHMTARLEAVGFENAWLEVKLGARRCFVPTLHTKGWQDRVKDPVANAQQFLSTPYLWAGNTGFGLDCSGLVQIAYHAAGFSCAADSHDQSKMAGIVPDYPEPGDLIFWKGHVAMETGMGTLIHANAHHMQVVEEDREAAILRIGKSETGPVTSRLRPEHQPL